jgi:hypothetical protein
VDLDRPRCPTDCAVLSRSCNIRLLWTPGQLWCGTRHERRPCGEGAAVRRLLFVLVSVLVLGLAVPASAASWRTYGTVRTDAVAGTNANYEFTALASGVAKDAKDIQLGVYTFGSSRTVRWEAEFYCEKGTSSVSREKAGRVTTSPNTWKWVNIRANATRMTFCDVWVYATPSSGAAKVSFRVR